MSHDLNKRVELKTERLQLRPFDFNDVDDVLGYASEPEFGVYLLLPQPYTRDDAAQFVARQLLDEWSTRPTFAIVLHQHVVGGIGLRIDKEDNRAEMGYALARPHWGRGLTLEAANAVMAWGFERYSLHKVCAAAALENRRSWRVMEKLGMTREGLRRSHSKVGDKHVDYVSYGILHAEWGPAGRG